MLERAEADTRVHSYASQAMDVPSLEAIESAAIANASLALRSITRAALAYAVLFHALYLATRAADLAPSAGVWFGRGIRARLVTRILYKGVVG